MTGLDIHRQVIALAHSATLPPFNAEYMTECLVDQLANIWELIPVDSRVAILGMTAVLKKHSDDGIKWEIEAMVAMKRMREAP